MYKKLLVPLDGSELSEVTFKYAKELASRFRGLEVTLLHVCDSENDCSMRLHRAYIEHTAELIREEAGRQAESRKVSVRGELVTGNPAAEILRFVNKNKIDLILMATHGRSGLNRLIMGSVTENVLREAKVPVLLVRVGIEEAIILDKLPERRILVALDGTKSAEAILPHVRNLAEQWGSEVVQIILVSVCEPPNVPSDYPADMPLSWDEHVARENAKCKFTTGTYLTNIEHQLKAAGFKVRSEISIGRASEKIIESSVNNRANVIAMVIHGRSGINRLAYGNTAEDVMQAALVPILLLRG